MPSSWRFVLTPGLCPAVTHTQNARKQLHLYIERPLTKGEMRANVFVARAPEARAV